jgi:hypothetical protein
MPRLTLSKLGILAATLSTIAFGFGCAKSQDQQAAAVQAKLRQPPAAAAPSKQPEIPPEAANVPRPY